VGEKAGLIPSSAEATTPRNRTLYIRRTYQEPEVRRGKCPELGVRPNNRRQIGGQYGNSPRRTQAMRRRKHSRVYPRRKSALSQPVDPIAAYLITVRSYPSLNPIHPFSGSKDLDFRKNSRKDGRHSTVP